MTRPRLNSNFKRPLRFERLEDRSLLAALINVDSTADSYARDEFLTLREAILVSNRTLDPSSLSATEQLRVVGTPSTGDTDTILFNLGTGTPLIAVSTALPTITDAVIIDGATGGATRVHLRGPGFSGGVVNGLHITAGASTIKSLVIGNFLAPVIGAGILLETAGGNTIIDCFIGTNASGTVGENTRIGVHINNVPNNTIGGTTTGERNVISGSGEHGNIRITGDGATGNVIQGNFVGTNASGAAKIGGPEQAGILIFGADNNLVGGTALGARNIISGHSGPAILLDDVDGNSATGNRIEGNYIGTDLTGTVVVDNSTGVQISDSSGNFIGGTATGAGNVISGNGQWGIRIISFASAGNTVQGNLIGTNATGVAALGNGQDGIEIQNAPGTLIGGETAGARNVISGNLNGIRISGGGGGGPNNGNNAIGTIVQGNYIGTDITGAIDLGNSQSGISNTGGVGTQIGGRTAAARNIISGNLHGIVNTPSNPSGSGDIIEGNYIGVAADGVTALGNSRDGVVLQGSGTLLGGTAAGAGNLISGNTDAGVAVIGTGNLIQGNRIGLAANGTTALPNGGNGVQISAGGNSVGGTADEAGNVIAFNGGRGVLMSSASSPILGNEIFSNGQLGIDLGNDGVTPNDVGDPDAGPNGLQNFPFITGVAGNVISATLNSLPTTTFRVEFFASDAADPSGNSEGQTLLGFANVTTDANGNSGTFTLSSPLSISGKFITATATRLTGGNPIETSEFSTTFTVQASPSVTINQAPGQADPASSSPILFAVVFGAPVTGFTGSDVSFAGSTVGGTLLANVSGSGSNYTIAVTGMTGTGTVVASIPAAAAVDANNAPNTASTSTDNSVAFATVVVAPTVTINQSSGQADPTSASPIQFTVVFSTPVTGFAGSDVSFAGSTVGGTLVASVSGSGANYTVSVTGMTGNGVVVASIPVAAATNGSNTPSAASTSTDNSVAFVTPAVAPTVTINQAAGQADPADSGPVQFTVVFSAPVTGFTSSDISFAGSTIAGTLVATVSGSGANYTVSVIGMTGSGTVVASIGAAAAVDGSNTASAASTSSDNSVRVTIAAPQASTLTFTLAGRQAKFKNDVGLYFVDDAAGRIGNFMPGDAGYARAALNRTKALISSRDRVGTRRTVNLPPGAFYGLYLIQNGTRSTFLARNPQNRLGRAPLMFFSFAAANPDGIDHVRQHSATRFAFEDQSFGGDRDYNDSILEVRSRPTVASSLATARPRNR